MPRRAADTEVAANSAKRVASYFSASSWLWLHMEPGRVPVQSINQHHYMSRSPSQLASTALHCLYRSRFHLLEAISDAVQNGTGRRIVSSCVLRYQLLSLQDERVINHLESGTWPEPRVTASQGGIKPSGDGKRFVWLTFTDLAEDDVPADGVVFE